LRKSYFSIYSMLHGLVALYGNRFNRKSTA